MSSSPLLPENTQLWRPINIRKNHLHTIKRKVRRRCMLRRCQYLIYFTIFGGLFYFIITKEPREIDDDYERLRKYSEGMMKGALLLDNGTGCEIPYSDPFASEIMKFVRKMPEIKCPGVDWVQCYLSECKVVDSILATTHDIRCTYQNIEYVSDHKYRLTQGGVVLGGAVYTLTKSDHVKIQCTGKPTNSFFRSKWVGHAVGFRKNVERLSSPPGRDDNINVLLFGFDSTSKNGFIRKMPKSYEYLMKELNGTLLEGYNVVGAGTPAALFPILTGYDEIELPSVQKSARNPVTMDDLPFIFNMLKADGYRTAYFEDMPMIGSFQFRFNGFLHQPADHYLRAFFLEEIKASKRKRAGDVQDYCVGAKPQYELMMNITEQFSKLDGKKFAFSFIADITHDNFNWISTADDATVKFLKALKNGGHLENTLLFFMGDHGSGYGDHMNTIQGKLEQRLPLMYIRLPEKLKQERPNAEQTLKSNARALTTPHDIHATVLDALRLSHTRSTYSVTGANLLRGLSLLEQIPKNRSCSEAGIYPHFCVCLTWSNVTRDDGVFEKSAQALLDYMNEVTQYKRHLCAPRTLISIEWVLQQQPNNHNVYKMWKTEEENLLARAYEKTERKNYQVKIVVGPGRGVFEATVVYFVAEDRFIVRASDISRTNRYGDEPSCVSATDPHLNMFCYCTYLLVKFHFHM